MTCPTCRAEVPQGARFCAECGQDLRLRGDERRVVTVLFADLVGYTALSETRDPEQVKNLIDGCFEHLVADIDAFGGRVDKIIGDAIVALFGAPVAHEDDAERAVRAALRMQETLASSSVRLGVAVQMRIGVNTGEVLVGALRSGGDYTAMGDVVNTANRLQTAALPGQVLVGAATHAATHRVLRYEELPPIDAKGREELVPAWSAEAAMAPPGYRPERNRAALIGRDPELGLLKHGIENAVRHERAGMLLLIGEAGVGKSRLAEELATLAALEHDSLVLEGRCVPYGEANVWWPVADALRHGCGIRSSDPATTAIELAEQAVRTALGDKALPSDVNQVLQGLLFLMGYESELRGIDATRAREEAITAAVTFVDRFSLQRPVIIVLSDLHWADDLVLGLLDTLLERLCSRRFVVLATARRGIEERWHAPHGRHNLVVLTLDPLTSDASSQLLAELAGEELDEGLADALLDRSGGNPFFLEELVTLLGEAGVVGGATSATELPDTLRGLVAARLDGLPPDERRVLDDCAVLGRRGPVSAIQVMARKHLGVEDVRPVLESLEEKELLLLSGVGRAEKWTFRSDVVREVAYGTLTKADRARAHAGIAAWMEAHENTELDAVIDRMAHHYVRSAELTAELSSVEGATDDVGERALHWLERAALRADQAETTMVAERLYSEGLRLLGGRHGPRHRAFLTGRARALAQQRELAAARADAAAAVHEARAAGGEGRRDLAMGLLALADIEQKESAWAASEAALAEAGAVFAALGDPSGEAEVQRLRGFGALFRFEYEEATELLEDAMARFESLGDRRGVAWALQNLAWCAFYLGRAEEAEGRLRTAAATFEEIRDKAGLGWAMGLLAWTRFQQGHSLEAEAMAEGIVDDIRNRGDKWALGMMLVLIGSVRLWTGRAASALPCLREAKELFTEIDDDFGRGQAGVVLGRALVASGAVREGFDLMAGLRGPIEGPIERERFIVVMSSAGAAVQVGDTERTAVLLGLSPDGPPSRGGELLVGDTEWIVATGLHGLQTGDVAGALEVLEGLHHRLGHVVDPNAHSALALALAADGQVARALAAADEVERHERSSYLDRIIAGVARGFAHERRGDHAASLAAFDQVRAAADATEDRVSGAVTALADAMAASARGEADAAQRMAEADGRLADLGLADTGWRRAFSLALGISSAA
ncbi:MAG: adenylate/guanylate cyclase domain-containing protein [Acidimicrobiales bacterium]|nr:adenylate/guanylate cyclase domain-containing protein [Acidimicrobiales bacterium]